MSRSRRRPPPVQPYVLEERMQAASVTRRARARDVELLLSTEPLDWRCSQEWYCLDPFCWWQEIAPQMHDDEAPAAPEFRVTVGDVVKRAA